MGKFKICFLFWVLICGLLILKLIAQEGVSQMKKVVMVIAEDNFRDEELIQPKEILEKNGIEVKVASLSLNLARGVLGAQVKPDILLSDVNYQDFAAVIFVGGAGSSQYWNDPVAHKLAQDAFHANKIVAAICIAPVTLVNAGILKGKRATVWSSEAGQLKAGGVNYTGRAVEKDGNIITANGPTAAKAFGEELVKALK